MKRCVVFLLLTLLEMVAGVVPTYLPTSSSSNERSSLIVEYFKLGFKYKEILGFLLLRHGILLSLRQLKNILKKLNLKRRGLHTYTPLDRAVHVIDKELQTSGQSVGYRSMWHRLRVDHNINVKRNDVMDIMKELDPDGTDLRKAHRLKRRIYCAKGPNYIWHMDGYDKLKPFGFCIHGAIDGFSRRLIWLEVSDTNNNPKLVAKYYLDSLKKIGKPPRILRCDAGTENSVVCLLQQYFRHEAADAFAGHRSVIVGKSTSNQRIERWWGSLRQQGVQWWMNFFKDLRDSGRFNELDPVHCANLKFCFMDLIQADLDRIAHKWNIHEIRPQHNAELKYGKPDVMYFLPEVFDTHEYGVVVDKCDVTCCKEMYSVPKGENEDFKELAQLLKNDLQMPHDTDAALQLFFELNELVTRADAN